MEKFIICPKDAFCEEIGKYLTKGVKYKVVGLKKDPFLADIIDDTGFRISVLLSGSSHTDRLPWKLVEEEQ